MNRNGGLIAAFVAVFTLLGVTNFSKSPGGSAPVQQKKASASTGSKTPAPDQPYAPCVEIRDRLRRLTDEAHGAPIKTWGLPKSCYEGLEPPPGTKPLAALSDVNFAVATLPNPVSTHLPLSFDRMVESIQQAAQDEGYTYDASWFPWNPDAQDYTSLDDQKAAEERTKLYEKQPGVLVFRRSNSPEPYGLGLIVFVVGEQPTGGINDEQFLHAVEWMRLLGGLRGEQLRIIGPAFSGSAPSLQRDLEQLEPQLRIQASSGTLSSRSAYVRLKSWMESRGNQSSFGTATENDALTMQRFCQYLENEGYDSNRVALLSEDETAFGAGPAAPKPNPDEYQYACPHAIRLYYPRDIATLRSAYESQSILTPKKPQSEAGAPSTALRGDLSEPSNGEHDTVRTFGGPLTALAQESILIDITNRLQEKQIQFIILRSTSSLDQIFLSEFLGRADSGARVVIDGADLLFSRGAEGRSLHGVMLLSTYPLLPWEQDWTASLGHTRTKSYRSFGEDTSEGTYIAARNLIRTGRIDVPIHDYRPPAWALDSDPKERAAERQYPATWLAVVGHRQFWPLAVLDDEPPNKGQESILQPFPAPGEADPDKGEPRPLRLPTAMWMTLIACLFWSMVHAYFCWSGCIMGSPRARTYFAPLPQPQHPALIALGSLLVAMVPVTITAASGLFSWKFTDYPRSEYLMTLLLLADLILAFAGCVRNYNLEPLRISREPGTASLVWRTAAGQAAFYTLIAFIVFHTYLISQLKPSNTIPSYLRSVNLWSGVSPLLPQLLLLAGGYLWFWCNLRGLAHFGDDRPVLPKEGELPAMLPMFSREKAGEPVERMAQPLTRDYLIRLLVFLALIIGLCSVALQGFLVRTLGERAFGRLIFFWVSLYMAVILTDGFEMWRAWSKHRELLVYLDRLPLRRTLRALKGMAWGSIWKMSGNVLEERYRVITFQLESLRHLTNSAGQWKPETLLEEGQKTYLLAQLKNCRQKSEPFAHWFVGIQKSAPTDLAALHDFQGTLAATAGTVMGMALLPAWRHETASLIFDRSKPDEKSGAEDKNPDKSEDTEPTRAEIPLYVQTAEEFFVLPYLAFIQNLLGRIRTITLGSLWLFVAATLAMSSYPFAPLDVLGGIFLAVFLIYGGTVALIYAQMSRDATLSHITNTQPGALGWDFWARLIAFGAGPLFGLLTTLFPSMTDFVFSWLQPSAQALK